MKKIILSLGVIVIFAGYAFYQHSASSQNPSTTSSSNNTSQNQTTSQTQSNVSYKDGTYTGNVANAFYGNLQVQATVSGGKLTDVKLLQYPSDRTESVQVNNKSNPILISEALTAQTANVQIVSGATQSSEAFQQSLGNALSQAQS